MRIKKAGSLAEDLDEATKKATRKMRAAPFAINHFKNY